MGVALHVIPCLDVHDGQAVKGINFRDLKDARDPVELTARCEAEGADELIFLDISASTQGRETTWEMVTRCAEIVFISLTVGGGMRSMADVDTSLRCGADKAGIDTEALADPGVIGRIAARSDSQMLVLSLDARRANWAPSGFEITTHSGRRPAGRDAIEWTKEAVDQGVRGVLFNSMDADDTTDGLDIGMIRVVRAVVDVPLIASSGARAMTHPVEAARAGVDAAPAASVFHYGRLIIVGVKQELARAGFEVQRV